MTSLDQEFGFPLVVPKGVQNLHPQRLEIHDIARDHGQTMHPRRGGDHGVFVKRVGFLVHQPRPISKYAPIHGRHLVVRQPVDRAKRYTKDFPPCPCFVP